VRFFRLSSFFPLILTISHISNISDSYTDVRTHTHTHTHTHRYAQLRELKEEGIVAAFELVHGREVRLYWRGMGAKETKRVRLSTVVFEYQCFVRLAVMLT